MATAWPDNGGHYRSVDLTRPWIPSPAPPVLSSVQTPLWATSPLRIDEIQLSPGDFLISPIGHDEPLRFGQTQRRSLWTRFVGRCTRFFQRKSLDSVADVQPEPFHSLRRRVTPSDKDWKAYGYFSRPRVNDVEVRNSATDVPDPHTIDVARLASSLSSPRPFGTPVSTHPERWISGTRHYSLPPRPSLWPDLSPHHIQSTYIDAPPSHCELNPFLRHVLLGPSPVIWNLSAKPSTVAHSLSGEVVIPLENQDLVQPATYPFVRSFMISCIADDNTSPFPWPVTISNRRGVRCIDIWQVIYDNMNTNIHRREWNICGWSGERKVQIERAYNRRKERMQGWGVEEALWEGVRRIDWLGERCMFRGLEPERGGNGWVLFVGTP